MRYTAILIAVLLVISVTGCAMKPHGANEYTKDGIVLVNNVEVQVINSKSHTTSEGDTCEDADKKKEK